MSQKAYVDSKN